MNHFASFNFLLWAVDLELFFSRILFIDLVCLHFLYGIFFSDQVKNVPDQIEKYKKRKYYLHATELLVSTGVMWKHFTTMLLN